MEESHRWVSRRGTIEIRSSCTQPFADIFTPVAFYTGLVNRIDAGLELVKNFLENNGIRQVNSVLRRKAVLGETIAPAEKMAGFLKELVNLVYQGLAGRGCGKEILLEALRAECGKIRCPAAKELDRLQKGLKLDELIKEYGSICSCNYPSNCAK
jgi:glutamate--cysteine ligase